MKPSDVPGAKPPEGPRKGAIPTPKEIIEKATPFEPGAPPPKPKRPMPD